MARPIKFNETVIDSIIEGLRKGLTAKAACKASSVSYSTLAAWMFKGKQAREHGEKNQYTAVLERIEHAQRIIWLEHRNRFFFDLKPRDYRYGWKNPMPQVTRKKISDFWRNIKYHVHDGSKF